MGESPTFNAKLVAQDGLTIDKNIPIPTRVKRRPGESVKLIASMDIGDSVFFKDQNTWVVYSRYFNVAKRQGRHIMVRAVDGGTRMWRDE